MKSRIKPKLPAHKIKHDRQGNEDIKRKGGMYTDSDEVDYEIDPQLQLTNLNAFREWVDWDEEVKVLETQSSVSAIPIREDEWRFLRILSTWIRVDQDGNGRLIFRSGDYGVLITKEEVTRCVTMVAQNRTMEEIAELIEFEVLYNSSTEEFGGTEGKGTEGH